MKQSCASLRVSTRTAALMAILVALPLADAWASKLVMKDGRVISGRMTRITSFTEQATAAPADGAPDPKLIVLVDDDLRRTFVPKLRVQEANEADTGEARESFRIEQHVAELGGRVAMVGPFMRISPWDEFGRRILEMSTNQGQVSVVQGITLITPTWIKADALDVKGKNLVWNMRIATNSIPREVLDKILAKRIDSTKIDQRLRLVRFYLQSERYQDARVELEGVVKDFPEQKDKFAVTLRELSQAYARRALAEIRVRRDGGQHKLAISLLENFPSDGVAGETLQAVKGMLEDYGGEYERYTEVLKKFEEHLEALQDSTLRDRLEPIRKEIFAELNIHSMARMTAYRQLWDDPALTVEEKLALAVSGWLVGANDATRKLTVALSLVATRDLVRRYLTEPVQLNRNRILAEFASQEGATQELVARLLAYLTPPLATEEPSKESPGYYELSVAGLTDEPEVTYYVQLPPEYDPHRRYPAVVTLNGAGTTPQQQIDWWAGARGADASRLGQASRHGYIVIAPVWAQDHQTSYRYSAAEHAAVLNSLRDACRRFAIDADRVFLSGHSMGGDAAWDMGAAHPDLWAGVIPIVAQADKYVPHYWENAALAPLYIVGGELDGDKMSKNAKLLDNYMKRGYNATVVEFQGRGHENFSDEILNLFDWMGRCQRDFFPRKFTCRTMRSFDNFFWWLEMDEFPEKTLVVADNWPPGRGFRAALTEAVATEANSIIVRTGAAKVVLWLSPDLVDFKRKVSINVNGGRLRANGPYIEPDLQVMLDDARTRGDRQHPFWAKIEMPAGKVNGKSD